jgi:hypothetical protein
MANFRPTDRLTGSHGGNGSTMFYLGDIGNSPAVFHFGIQGLSLFDVTQLVSKHGQTRS